VCVRARVCVIRYIYVFKC